MLRRTVDPPPQGIELGISDLVYSLKSLMWRQVGVERKENALEEAIGHITFWFDAVRRLTPAEPRAWELVNMLSVAKLASLGALRRSESRGVHFRSDYQDMGEPVHTIIKPSETKDHCIEGVLEHVHGASTLAC